MSRSLGCRIAVRMRVTRCWIAALVLALALPALAQERKLPPVNEAANDLSWVTFRNRLLTALEKRDRKFVLGIVARNVRNSLDAPRGLAEFRKQWAVDGDDSPLWRELASALFLGGAYVKREQGPAELCAPYVSVKWPQDIDAFGGGAIVTKDVLVKSAPSSGSDTIATLSYHIIEVADWEVADQAVDSRQIWVKVKLKSGEGFVPEEQIRSPIEHTACFLKTADGWRLTGFGPGGGN